MILHTIAGITGISIRGVKTDNQSQYNSLTVLRSTYTAMPAVLVELGFVTNVLDRGKLTDKYVVESLAKKLAEKLVTLDTSPAPA